MKKSPLALAIAAVLFAGWLTYLGVQALREHQHREDRPIVSRAQLAVSQYDVDVDLPAGSMPTRVKVQHVRWAADGKKPDGEITITNLRRTQGFAGPGAYRLPLVRTERGEYEVAGTPGPPEPLKPDSTRPADPGFPPGRDPPSPRIYPLTPEVQRQWDEIRGPAP